MNGATGASGLALAAGALSLASLAQAQIADLGTLPGGATSSATGVSADGRTVVGTSATSTYGHGAIWREGVITDMGVLGSGRLSIGNSVSGDGAVAVGSSGFMLGPGVHAVRFDQWLMDLTPQAGANSSNGWGVNGDGSIVVGEGAPPLNAQAFRWSASGGFQHLGLLPEGTYSQAYGVSDDGAVVVGGGTSSAGYRGFVWTEASGMTALGTLPGGTYSRAWGVSRNGLVPFGESDQGGTGRAVRWTAAGIEDLGLLAGWSWVSARAASADGSIVVGFGSTPNGSRPFLWSAQTGMVDLNVYLPSQGVDLTDWVLTDARGVSTDGKVLVGTGLHQIRAGLQRAWRVDLTGVCYANCDGSQEPPVLNVADFSCFLQRFAAGAAYANCDASTTPPVLNVADFTCYLQRFAAGCE